MSVSLAFQKRRSSLARLLASFEGWSRDRMLAPLLSPSQVARQLARSPLIADEPPPLTQSR